MPRIRKIVKKKKRNEAKEALAKVSGGEELEIASKILSELRKRNIRSGQRIGDHVLGCAAPRGVAREGQRLAAHVQAGDLYGSDRDEHVARGS